MGIPVYTGGRVPCGVTAHGNPTGPLQFDRLEVAPTARCTPRTHGNVGKVTSPPCPPLNPESSRPFTPKVADSSTGVRGIFAPAVTLWLIFLFESAKGREAAILVKYLH